MNVLIDKKEVTERGMNWHQIYKYMFHTPPTLGLIFYLSHTHANTIRKIHTPVENAAISPLFKKFYLGEQKIF